MSTLIDNLIPNSIAKFARAEPPNLGSNSHCHCHCQCHFHFHDNGCNQLELYPFCGVNKQFLFLQSQQIELPKSNYFAGKTETYEFLIDTRTKLIL